VLVIDTGYDRGHEDLPYGWTSHCGGSWGGCNDGEPIPHGSHVSGIAVAKSNGVGVVGGAYGVYSSDFYSWGACSSATGVCTASDVIAGLNQAVAWDVDVVNMSLRLLHSAGLENAVAVVRDNNIVQVAAAGNEGIWDVTFPAAYIGVIGVSGVGTNKQFATAAVSPCPDEMDAGSSYGSHVDLSAPYWALSTVPGNNYEDEDPPGYWCGTSMATPHVTAAVALIRGLKPTLPNYQVELALFISADDRGAPGHDALYGYGVLDAAAAVQPLLPLTVTIEGPTSVRPWEFCTWQANVSGGTGGYTYQWSGVLSGTTPSVSGNVSESGSLAVTVNSGDGRQGNDEIDITVSSSAPSCW